MSNNNPKIIINRLVEFLFLGIITLLPAVTVYTDIIVIGHGLSDHSVTEYTQETMIFLSAMLFFYGAWKTSQSRGFLLLVAGFFSCIFIREHDELLNNVFHGFWVYPATLTAIVTIAGAIICRNTILGPMATFVETKAGYNIFFGLLVVLMFSRVFGSGHLLWIDVMGDDYDILYKSAIQEGIELFGYMFILYGSLLFIRSGKNRNMTT